MRQCILYWLQIFMYMCMNGMVTANEELIYRDEGNEKRHIEGEKGRIEIKRES